MKADEEINISLLIFSLQQLSISSQFPHQSNHSPLVDATHFAGEPKVS